MFGENLNCFAVKPDSEKAVLQNAITAADQQIDALVYELYGLTEAEIKLVEDSQIEPPKVERKTRQEQQAALI
jgi:hypothetical protein